MKRNIYDVYDLDGNLVIEKMTGTEIAKELNVKTTHVAKCANENKRMLNKYKVVVVGTEENDRESILKRKMLEEWERIIKPFKNVIWVKEMAPGVRKLRV